LCYLVPLKMPLLIGDVMDCACTCTVSEDYEPCTLIDASTPKARKEHTCSECYRTITRGEEYRREFLKWDNTVHVQKYCEDCLSLRGVFFNQGWVYDTLWSDMYEFVQDCAGEVSVQCLLELTPTARGKVCDLIQETWEED